MALAANGRGRRNGVDGRHAWRWRAHSRAKHTGSQRREGFARLPLNNDQHVSLNGGGAPRPARGPELAERTTPLRTGPRSVRLQEKGTKTDNKNGLSFQCFLCLSAANPSDRSSVAAKQRRAPSVSKGASHLALADWRTKSDSLPPVQHTWAGAGRSRGRARRFAWSMPMPVAAIDQGQIDSD